MSKNVCDEFIRIHKLSLELNQDEDFDFDFNNIDYSNPIYTKLNLMCNLNNMDIFEDKDSFDINKIGTALLDYIKSNNIQINHGDEESLINFALIIEKII